MDRLEGGRSPLRKSITSFNADAEGPVAAVSATFATACTKNSSSASSSVESITSNGFSAPEMIVSEMEDQ